MTRPSVSVLLDRRLPTEGIRSTDRSVLPGTSNFLAMAVSGQRSDHSRLPSAANEGMPPLKIIGEHRPRIPVFPNMVDRSGVKQSYNYSR